MGDDHGNGVMFLLGMVVGALLIVAFMVATVGIHDRNVIYRFLGDVAPEHNTKALHLCLSEGEYLGVKCGIYLENQGEQ